MPLLFPYQDKDTRIHRLDARPKMIFVLSIFLLSILISDILYLFVLFTFVMIVVVAAKVLRPTLHLLKYTLYVAAFIFIFTIIFANQGTHIMYNLGPIQIKQESILFATSMSMRLFLTTAAFCVLTFTVHPDKVLQNLSKFGYKSMAGLSIAMRMYPTIASDSKNIEDAMKARGVEFDTGNMIQKARARAPVMMPLLLTSLDRSMEIAEAMESRGFGRGKRTNYYDDRLTLRAKVMIGMFLAAIPFGVIAFIFGYGNADYLSGAAPSLTTMGLLVISIEVLLFAPLLMGEPR
jgi:energy-coupling factor transport system permease protein